MTKYRIVYRKDRTYPYHVERKEFIFWKQIEMADSLEKAKRHLMDHIGTPKPKDGEILMEYDTRDLLADKLTGKVV